MTTMEDADAKPTTPRRKVTTADLRRVNLGKAFWGSRSDLIQHQQTRELVMRYRRNIVEMARTGSGLMFNGPLGVGKTSAAACVLKEAVAAGLSAYFVTHTELKELRFEKKDLLFGDGTDGITVRKKIETTNVLVIDGLNEPFFTDNVFGTLQLEELLTKRYSEKLATILTTRSGATLKLEKHADLFDLVSQCMVPVQMTGKNMRDKDREALKSRVFGDD